MCGIAGFIGSGDQSDLVAMSAALARRGPDGVGNWVDASAGIFLTQRRLAVIDIACGEQPMWNADGTVGVVFNGEIYNHVELRRELTQKGHIFRTDHSDTEVLVHGYIEWGSDLPIRLNGMFAFAILDRRTHTLFMARDRFGKKPLYYHAGAGLFAFASELTALTRHHQVPKNIDVLSVQKYFAYGFIPAPRSLYQDIQKLPGGHLLQLNLNSRTCSVSAYWKYKIEPIESIPAKAEALWGEELRALLSNAVKRRLMGDVPLGIFLSGGIDSSAILAFAAQHQPGKQNKTFSIGFNEASFDESEYARLVAAKFDSDHYERILDLNTAAELIPTVLSQLDEPMADSSIIPTYLLSKFAREKVTVALGGDGGDEMFAGYDPFKALKAAKWYQRLVPRPIHAAIRSMVELLPVSESNLSLEFKLKRTLRGLSYGPACRNAAWLGSLEATQIGELFGTPVAEDELYAEAIDAWENSHADNDVDKTLEFYARFYLQDDILTKVDRASMMVSLEARAPFLDNDVVDFARRLPHQYKYRAGQTKYILKKALEPMLPASILYRRKKGFGVPMTRWLKSMSQPAGDLPSIDVNDQWVDARWHEHRAGTSDHRQFLWSWIVLQAKLAQN